MMLTAMIFAANGEPFSRIQRRCIDAGGFNLFRTPDYRPSAPDMVRIINSFNPELVFFEVYDREDAIKVESTIHISCPNVALLGFADNWDADRTLKANGGYLRVIPSALAPADFVRQVEAAIDAVRVPCPDNAIVFLPAKAGSGASTVALNVTGALAHKCGKSAILIEADVHSGPAAMYLNLNPKRTVVDALQESHRLEACWDELVMPVQNFTILPAFRKQNDVPHQNQRSDARLRYEHVVFDLPEVVNDATEVIVSNARTVYVVCTPEVPSLMLARKRCAGLIDRGVPEDRLKIVLNRHSKDGPEPSSIGQILGYPVTQLIPNDYKSLWEANLKRCLVPDKSAAGRAYESFAWSLSGRPEATVKPARGLFRVFSAA